MIPIRTYTECNKIKLITTGKYYNSVAIIIFYMIVRTKVL